MMVFEEQLRPGGIFFPLACGFKVLGIPDLSGALMLLGGTASVFGAVCWLRGLTASLLQRKALCLSLIHISPLLPLLLPDLDREQEASALPLQLPLRHQLQPAATEAIQLLRPRIRRHPSGRLPVSYTHLESWLPLREQTERRPPQL